METATECKTPGRSEFSPSVVDTPARTPKLGSSLLTPCRQIGLRRKSLKNFTPPGIRKESTPITTSPMPKTFKPSRRLSKCSATRKEDLVNGPSLSVSGGCQNIDKIQEIAVNKTNAHSICQINTVGSSEKCKDKIDEVNFEMNIKSKGLQRNYVNETNTSNIEDGSGDHKKTSENLNTNEQTLQEKKETLRRLELMVLYKRKHNIDELHELTRKWQQACQIGLQKIHEILTSRGQTITIPELITQLGISADVAAFNPETDEFE